MTRRCLVNGKHTPGSEWERGCPLRNAPTRSARARRAAATPRECLEASEKDVSGGARRVVAGRSQTPLSGESKSNTSETVSRDGPVRLKSGRAGCSGRPLVPARFQQSKAAKRARDHGGSPEALSVFEPALGRR